MALSIKSSEAERLARELARETGESLTQVVLEALREKLRRLRGRRHATAVRDQVNAVLERLDQLPRVDQRSEDEILGYDERGIPEN